MLRIFLVFLFLGYSVNTLAELSRHPEFVAPAELRPRVDFWVGVFAKYGKHHVVMHHRQFPQAIYSVLDMTQAGDQMSAVQFELHKKSKVKAETQAIARAINKLSQGIKPQTILERNVQLALTKVPGGQSKYRKALEKEMIRSQTGIKEKFAESIKRSGRYMHVLEHVFVNEHGLPIELTRLPLIESSFDYTAYSSVGAAGIWQFMPRTAKSFGMQVGKVIDERRDVLKATKAAARYLTQAYNSLDRWPLAVTSYNHGVGGVRKKISQAGTNNIVRLIEYSGEPYFGFASGNFWPELIAALDVYDNYKTYFPGLVKEAPRHYVTHTLSQAMSPRFASSKLGVSVDTLQEYNYALAPAVWKGHYHIPKGYQLKFPKSVANRSTALSAIEQSVEASNVYGGVKYTVRKGDNIGLIARRYGVSVAQIRDLNNLSNNIIHVGQKLLIKAEEAHYPVAGQKAQTQKVVSASKVTTHATSGSYIVKSGDSISGIAARHGLSIAQLMSINNLKSSAIRVGQKLNVSKTSSSSYKVIAPAKTQKSSIYIVRSGDTLWSVSKKLNCTVDQLKRTNQLRTNAIKVGQKLKVP